MRAGSWSGRASSPHPASHDPTGPARDQKPARTGALTYGAGLAVGLSLVVSGCGKHGPASSASSSPALPPATVKVETISPRRLSLTDAVTGTVRSRVAVEIEAKVNGRIVELPVRLGQMVKEGDVLVSLATQELTARLEQATAALRQAETEFERVTRLHGSGAAMRSELDNATFRLEGARASVAEAQALLAYAHITAPINGVVARKDAEVGDLAVPGKVLLRLEDPTHLRLEAEVPDSVLARVPNGAKLPIRVDALGLELEGQVVEVAPLADPATRSVRVKLDLPATPGLRSGQFGRLAIPVADAERLLVPPSAVVRRGQLDLIFVAGDGRAQMRLIRPGRVRPEGLEILAGLEPGERVVVEGATNLRDGQPLQSN